MVTYRTSDPARWGTGKGANLTAGEIDGNFWELAERIAGVEGSAPQPNNIANVTVTGSQMTIHMQDGTTHGPFTLPTAMIHYRGDWVAGAAYSELDLVAEPTLGIFLVLRDHTAAATFDAAATDASGNPLYRYLFPISGGAGALSELSDVSVGTPTDGMVLTCYGGTWYPDTIPAQHINDLDGIYNPEGATTGQVLAFNVTGTGWWEPMDLPAGGGGAITFLSLTDTPAAFGAAGQVAAVNNAGDGLVFVDPPSGAGGAGALSDLSDVTLSTPAAADFLRYNGTAWEDAPVTWGDVAGKPVAFLPDAHTHTTAEVSNFTEALQDGVAGMLLAGTNVTLTYDDAAGTLTVAVATGAGGGSGESAQLFADPFVIPLLNADFESATDLEHWTVEVGSATTGPSTGNGYPGEPYNGQTGKFLKHDVNDSASFEVSQTHAVDMPHGGFVAVSADVLQTSSLDDEPFARLTFYGAGGAELSSYVRHWSAGVVDVFKNRAAYFTAPAGTASVKVGVGGRYVAGTITNVGLDNIRAEGYAFVEGSGGASTFLGLGDTPAAFGAAGQMVVVNGAANAFEFADPPTGGGAGALDDLSDVTLTTPASGQLLRHDGATWGNGAVEWSEVGGKPTTFPPSSHSHAAAEISNFAFLTLDDTPTTFGTPGQLPAVNAARDALEFVDPPRAAGLVRVSQIGDYTLTEADFDGAHLLRMDAAGANTVTVPPGITSTGEIIVVQEGLGQTRIAAGASVVIKSAGGLLAARAQYSSITLIPDGPDSYYLIGDLA